MGVHTRNIMQSRLCCAACNQSAAILHSSRFNHCPFPTSASGSQAASLQPILLISSYYHEPADTTARRYNDTRST